MARLLGRQANGAVVYSSHDGDVRGVVAARLRKDTGLDRRRGSITPDCQQTPPTAAARQASAGVSALFRVFATCNSLTWGSLACWELLNKFAHKGNCFEPVRRRLALIKRLHHCHGIYLRALVLNNVLPAKISMLTALAAVCLAGTAPHDSASNGTNLSRRHIGRARGGTDAHPSTICINAKLHRRDGYR